MEHEVAAPAVVADGEARRGEALVIAFVHVLAYQRSAFTGKKLTRAYGLADRITTVGMLI